MGWSGITKSGTKGLGTVTSRDEECLRVGITTPAEQLASQLLNRLCVRYPRVKVSVVEMAQEQIELALSGGVIDCGVTLTNTGTCMSRLLGAQTEVLSVADLILAVGAKHRFAHHSAPIGLHQLRSEKLVLFHRPHGLRTHFEMYCNAHGVNPNVVVETNSAGVIVQLARSTTLSTILPLAIAREKNLSAVAIVPEIPRNYITLVMRRDDDRCAAYREFLRAQASLCQ